MTGRFYHKDNHEDTFETGNPVIIEIGFSFVRYRKKAFDCVKVLTE
jgi:hypothetical protein